MPEELKQADYTVRAFETVCSVVLQNNECCKKPVSNL
jgi:hypothetical protein